MAFRQEQYAASLADYLKERSEAALSNAYTHGRLALASGVSLAHLIETHFSALAQLGSEHTQTSLLFLIEAIAPYEMSLRGFREATESLRALNETLNSEVERRTQELLAAQEKLNQAQKLDSLGRMAGGISHDFNNILSVILTYTAVMASDLPSDSPLRQDLAEVKAAAQRGAALTKQLLAFSRQRGIDNQSIEVRAAVEEISALLRRVLPASVTLEHEFSPQATYVFLGRGQLEQVIMNLVLNARDAMPQGGTVSLRATEKVLDDGTSAALGVAAGLYVELQVRDAGTGMPPEVCSQIFEPFFTTKGGGAGTGLGLPTVLGIVRKNGGAIEIDSTPGEGTAISVYLPVATQSGPSAPETQAASAIAGDSLLLVEDNQTLRQGTAKFLRDAGYHVVEAAEGNQALEYLDTQGATMALVISDIMMPGMGGLQLYDRAKTQWPALQFLFISGYWDQESIPSDPAVRFLQKPFEPAELLATIQSILSPGPETAS